MLAAADSKRGSPIAAVKPDFDLVRFDLNIPGLSGIPALKAWRRRYPETPVVVLSSDRARGDRRRRDDQLSNDRYQEVP